MRVRAVLFDFDGTLVDSASGMAHALNRMRRARGRPELPVAQVRPHVNHGARGMVAAGFGITPADAGFEGLRDEFCAIYAEAPAQDAAWMAGAQELVEALAARGVPWGIVTNKSSHFARPIAQVLDIQPSAGCFVCGDTTAHTKPHPAPLLHAALLLRIAPAQCLYVGDDARDMEAAQAAGMTGVAAAYGYVHPQRPLSDWGARHTVTAPHDVLAILDAGPAEHTAS